MLGRQEPEAKVEREEKFEARIFCFNCIKTRHIAANCSNQKLVLMSVVSNDENMKLLQLHMRDIVVNRKPCRLLRDSTATEDVVHPSYVKAGMFTGECAWIEQAVETGSACLPVARVSIEGPFGTLETGATVSSTLPP